MLEGDSNEEQRLKPVLEEKMKAAIHGKLDRITQQEIDEKARLLSVASKEEETDRKPSRLDSARVSTKSGHGKIAFTPRGTVMNPKLKKAMMAEE